MHDLLVKRFRNLGVGEGKKNNLVNCEVFFFFLNLMITFSHIQYLTEPE